MLTALVACTFGAAGAAGAAGAGVVRKAARGSSIAIIFFTEPGPGAGDGAIACGMRLLGAIG